MPVRDGEWLGSNGFTWFIGIVEDRNDPLRIGRVRVRCFGWHTSDKETLSTEGLPWAQVMIPVTSASTSGVGNSPTGLVEGSWVIGFFMDGNRAQQPMVMGSFHGVSGDANNENAGFNDPYGTYPLAQNLPDTTGLAIGGTAYTNHSSTLNRAANRESVIDVPTGRVMPLSSVTPDENASTYEVKTWNMPALHSDTVPPLYPFNHVRTTESGHVLEFDDTVGARRIHEYHASGTNREIRDDGTRTTYIVGDDFEVIVKDKNVLINGNCNITIKGDARVLVSGNMVQEVVGDYHLSVRGNMHTKVDGNKCIEVLGSINTQVNTNEGKRVTGDSVTTVGGDVTENFNGTHQRTTLSDSTRIVQGDFMEVISGKSTNVAAGEMVLGAGSEMNIAGGSSLTAGSPGPTVVKGSTIDLNPP
jgi:hypothetical protein